MKITKAFAENFQSYETLEFEYDDLGLALVSGPTGAGKSTLLDVPCWTLFGTTSKESAADDVRAWDGEGATRATVFVELPSGNIQVIRKRGKSSIQNDLYWVEANGDQKRGKDLLETQKMLEQRLGVTADMFLVGSYMTQFSRADSFFIAKAKERREVLEKIADQSFAIKLGERASEARKEAKRLRDTIDTDRNKALGRESTLQESLRGLADSSKRWAVEHKEKLKVLEHKLNSFDEDREAEVHGIVSKLEELDKITVSPGDFDARAEQFRKQLRAFQAATLEYRAQHGKWAALDAQASSARRDLETQAGMSATCATCGQDLSDVDPQALAEKAEALRLIAIAARDAAAKQKILVDNLAKALTGEDKVRKAHDQVQTDRSNNDRLLDQFEALQAKAKALKSARNPYGEQLEAAQAEANPFDARLADANKSLAVTSRLVGELETKLAEVDHRVASLTWLYDKSFELRGLLMEKAVRQVNGKTNEYLEKYFDAALRVELTLADSDKLEVAISNDGYPAPFRQLSGGERCQLKLAFSLSLMRAAQDRAGVAFGMVMLDEALGGLDDSLKVKAFGLLQQLENEFGTVLLIDHCEEFKGLFASRFTVTKDGGHSHVEAA